MQEEECVYRSVQVTFGGRGLRYVVILRRDRLNLASFAMATRSTSTSLHVNPVSEGYRTERNEDKRLLDEGELPHVNTVRIN